jgi:ABC-type multidrug transport system fused ATPase/permease subunit
MHMMLGFVEHLLKLPYSFFQQRSAGDLLTRMASNAMLRDILGNQLIATLLDSSLVIFYLIILLWLSLPFGLVTLGIGVLQVLLLLSSSRSISNLAGRELAAQGKAQGYLAEMLEGIATLKGSGAEQRAFERWSNLFFDQLNISMRYSYFSSTMSMIMTALGTLAPLALLWVGAIQVLNGSITLGTMVALTALAGTFLTPLSSVVTSGQRFQLIGAHLDRIADVTEAEPEQKEQEVQQPPQLTGDIRLEYVSFSYAADVPEVLHGIDLTVEAGQKVAIVGPSGSGKSTLGKLLLGLYAPTKGTILYDSIPLQQLNYQEVRRQFGVVLQESALFSGSVFSNIALNNPTIDKEQVVEAAEIAAIHEDIMDMPMGYETLVAEGGSALSGGQRQRLAIARAIAHKPSILLLDEATSHLDVATEQRVAERLQTLACTQIIIAHRLSTIRNADVILVMNHGNIVESGSHEELLRRNGYYARLMHQQLERGIVTPDKAKAEVNEASIAEEPTIPLMKALRTRIPHKVLLEPTSPDFSARETSPQFTQTSSSNGHVVLPPERDSLSEEATVKLPSHLPLTTLTPSPGTPVSSAVTAPGLTKRDTVVAGLLIMLLTIILSAGLLLVLVHTESKPAIQRTSPLPAATVVVSVTPTPNASIYPSLTSSYVGTVSDLKTTEHTPLLLTNIQQSQGKIQGSFKGLGLAGPFKGSITPSRQVQFTVTIGAGKEMLMFEGNIKTGGDMAGSFSVLDSHGQHTGEAGLWNVAASPVSQ